MDVRESSDTKEEAGREEEMREYEGTGEEGR